MYKFLYSNQNDNQINFCINRGYHEEDYFIHTHDFTEFAIVTEGECTHVVNGCEYPLKRGEVYVILPNVWHGLKDVKQTLRHYTFKFNFTNLILFDVELKTLSGFFQMFMPSNKGGFKNRLFLTEDELATVSEICEIMLKEYEEKKPGHELVLRAMLISLIGIMLRSYKENTLVDIDSYEKILPAIKHIEKHFDKKITLEVLAEKCFLSSRQLSRLFNKVYDKSPADYLLEYRLTTAYLHLMTTRESVSSISKKCGFYDESHMAKLFFKHYGFSPGKVRNRESIN